MKIFVKVKPGKKENKIVAIDSSHFDISIKARPTNGDANNLMIKILADYFTVAQKQVKILHGHTSPNKIIDIEP